MCPEGTGSPDSAGPPDFAVVSPVTTTHNCCWDPRVFCYRAFANAHDNSRQRSDVASAVTETEIFDFLMDIVPEEPKTVRCCRVPSPRHIRHPQRTRAEKLDSSWSQRAPNAHLR